jgi:hypothetical protein
MDRLPVVYVRGYAGATAGIDSQVDDPFYGSTLVRRMCGWVATATRCSTSSRARCFG